MTGAELLRLAEQIRRELVDLERVLERVHEGWQGARSDDNSFYLDSVALNLHGYYSGLERIFVWMHPKSRSWSFPPRNYSSN